MTAPDYTEFNDPRLVALYDTFNAYGDDTEFFCALAEKLSAATIIDLGCGTGLLTCELAKRGHQMIGIDPAPKMLSVARSKPYANQVTWREGSFEKMQDLKADMVLMTSHVAQFFLDDKEWKGMLRASHAALHQGGYLVFDIRRLTDPPFSTWPTKDNPRRAAQTPLGAVEWWFNLLELDNGRVKYELHYSFVTSNEEVVSVNELVFRTQDEVLKDLSEAGFIVDNIYGDWDASPVHPESPEMVFIARIP